MRTVHMVSGMPRACSTLLCNLLAQNPRVHATATSGLHEIMYISKAYFKTEEFRSLPAPSTGESLFMSFMRAGIANAFDSITDRPVVADKCRSWIGSYNLLAKINPEAKLIVPIRDVRGALSSLEKRYQQHPEFQLEANQQDTAQIQNVEGRAQFWLSRPPLGIAIQRIHELVRTGAAKNVLFVHAEDLTEQPAETMAKVWDYLDEDFTDHDFSNVEQYTHEHELGWPYGEHAIRREVKPLVKDWHDTLGRQLSGAITQKFNWINNL